MKRLVTYFFPNQVKKDLLTAFVNEVVKINNKYPYINYGGCGAMAVILYDKLKQLGFKPKICVFVYSKKDFAESLEMYFEHGLEYYIDERTEGFPHIIVKAGGYYIDSTGVYNSYKEMRVYGCYSLFEGADVDFIRECSEEYSIWNNAFDRNHIPDIQKRIDKIYQKIMKENLVVSE